MNKVKNFVLILLLGTFSLVNAQTLDVKALTSFSPAIARQVFEVSQYVKLTGEQQQALARAFEEEDAAFVSAIESDGGILSVKSERKIAKMRDKTLANVLSDDQLQQYYRGVFDAEAAAEGNEVANTLQKQYNLTDQNWKFIRVAFYKLGLETRVINKLMADKPAQAKKKIAALRAELLQTIEDKGGIRVNDDMTVTEVRAFDPNHLHRY